MTGCEVFIFQAKPVVRRGADTRPLAGSDLSKASLARDLLRVLVACQPASVSRTQFQEANSGRPSSNSLAQAIGDLRRRLGDHAVIVHNDAVALSAYVATDFAAVVQALRDGGDRKVAVRLTAAGLFGNGEIDTLGRLANPYGPKTLLDVVQTIEARTRVVVRDALQDALAAHSRGDFDRVAQLLPWLLEHPYALRIQAEGLWLRLRDAGGLTARPALSEHDLLPMLLSSVAAADVPAEPRSLEAFGPDHLRTGRICRIREAAWTAFDVAAPAIDLVGDDGLPPFVGRGTAERSLRAQVRVALRRHGVTVIVATGPPRAGKSRLLYEVLRSECPDAWMIAPWDGRTAAGDQVYLPSTHEVINAGASDDPVVLWLPDVERFVGVGGDGLNEGHVAQLQRLNRPVLIVGASGGKGSAARDPAKADVLKQFLALSCNPISVDRRLTLDELEGLNDVYRNDPATDARIRRLGLGPTIVASPEMRQAYGSGEHPAFGDFGPPDVMEGLALVDGLLAWLHCASAESAPDTIAHELWRVFRPVRGLHSRADLVSWDMACRTATRELVPGLSLAGWTEVPEGWEPNTLLLDFADRDGLVSHLLTHGTGVLEGWARADSRARFFAIALRTQAWRVDLAERWYRSAIVAGDTKALNNLGVLLSNREGSEREAEALLRAAMASAHGEARENLRALLERRGQTDEAAALGASYSLDATTAASSGAQGNASTSPRGALPASASSAAPHPLSIDDLTDTEQRLLSDLFAIVEEHASDAAVEVDRERVEDAFVFACEHHADQRRKSGEEFITHPVGVAKICAGLRLDTETLIAALLHDTVEDTSASLAEVNERFGDEVASLVDGVTKLTGITFQSRDEAQAENYRKMMVAMASDIRVILIKLADRLHNMRTIAAMPRQKQIDKAKETLEIFAPIAHRLGIHAIKWELEDLAFAALHPRKYQEIKGLVNQQREEREDYAWRAGTQLAQELEALGIQAEISGRAKHFYAIYSKMTKKGREFNEIYDLIALRVIVGSVKDCYGAVGVIHSLWKPLPGRFKDFIAMPKFNLYQALHAPVIGPQGQPLEIQIRTREMHDMAEFGVAAHWIYKVDPGAKPGSKQADPDAEGAAKVSWIRSVLDWQQERQDPKEFMENLKVDLFDDEVYVFTPKGEVRSLASGATPLDFAYEIHTEIGHRCVGARVNGKIVPLHYELRSGDIVEVLVGSHESGPGREWLEVAKTPRARRAIRRSLARTARETSLESGRQRLFDAVTSLGLVPRYVAESSVVAEVGRELGFATTSELFQALGDSKIAAETVAREICSRLRAG